MSDQRWKQKDKYYKEIAVRYPIQELKQNRQPAHSRDLVILSSPKKGLYFFTQNVLSYSLHVIPRLTFFHGPHF